MQGYGRRLRQGWPPPQQHQDHWFEGAPADLEKHARPVHTHLASPGALDFWEGRVLAFWDWFVHNKFCRAGVSCHVFVPFSTRESP